MLNRALAAAEKPNQSLGLTSAWRQRIIALFRKLG
jgi:hypothetical protein